MKNKDKEWVRETVEFELSFMSTQVDFFRRYINSLHNHADDAKKRMDTFYSDSPPPRDRYLTTLVTHTFIGKIVTLKDGDTLITGKVTGINDLYSDKPIFEIDGQLRNGVPVKVHGEHDESTE